MLRKLSPVLVLLAMFFLGCSGNAGSKGDANDPEKTSDLEMMKDETGDVGNNNLANKKKK